MCVKQAKYFHRSLLKIFLGILSVTLTATVSVTDSTEENLSITPVIPSA